MSIQVAELHFSTPPKFEFGAVKDRAAAILGEGLDTLSSEDSQRSYLIGHPQHAVTYTEGTVPAQTAILVADQPIELERYADKIQQSWGWPDCESALAKSRHTLSVCEMMAGQLPPADRVRLFHGVLQALVEQTRPDAIVFHHTQQVIHPEAYLGSVESPPILRPGSLNVRFFNVADSEDDMLMDVRGLDELGLHDVQCHFRGLDPDDVARLLFNTAVYVFENGPVIESGNTIAGVGQDAKWQCQFEPSLLEPDRELLDLNPGPPHAAGNRH